MIDLTDKYIELSRKTGHNPNLLFLEGEIANYRILVMQGGTRSGKTWSGCQFYWRSMDKYSGVEYSIVRGTLPALKATVMKDFFAMGIDAGVYSELYHNKTDKEYRYNGNLLDYFSVEDGEKTRGRKRHVLYMNEAPELEWEPVQQLLWRTTSKIIIDYNPSYPESWVYDNILTRDDCAMITTTYLDNPYLSQGQLNEILWLKENDPDAYRIYGLGQRGELRGQIYKNWKRIDELPIDYPSAYIIDFGFTNDPTAITECKKHNRAMYAKEHIYRTGLDNIDIAICLFFIGCKSDSLMIADSAEPKSIREIRIGWDLSEDYIKTKCLNLGYEYKKELQKALKEGFWVLPTVKGQDSIDNGIQAVKQHEVFVTSDSANAWREYYRYRWKEDDKTGTLLNVPIDKDNHFCDTVRYYALMENRVY